MKLGNPIKQPKITLLWTLYSPVGKNMLPSLSIACLSKVLEEKNFEVKCIDCNLLVYGKWGYDSVNPKNKDHILFNLVIEAEKTEPGILAVGCWTEGVSFLREFVKVFKKRNPDVKVIMGGPLATFLPEKVLQFIPEIDYLVRGEGELTLLELVEKISKGEKTQDTLGISFKGNQGQFVNNPNRPLIKDLDKLPLTDFKNFVYIGKPEGLQVITSRGCPCNCNYCSSGNFYDCYRFYSPEYTVKQIKHLLEIYSVRSIQFSDDNVFYYKERSRKLLNLIAQEKIDCDLPASIKVDDLNEEITSLLKKARIPWLTVGVENIMPEVLVYYNRTQNPKKYLFDVFKGVRLIEQCGVNAAFTFVIGSPIETEQDMLKNLDFMKRLYQKGFWIYASILRLVPGSFFWSKYMDKKINIFKLNRTTSFSFDDEYLDMEWVCPLNFAFENKNYSNERFVEICDNVMYEVGKFET